MIRVIPSDQRHQGDFGWLKARWHFSFGDYHDPANMNWGPLRVFNDDLIQGGGEFGMHPHRDMEIITWLVEGELEHRDRLGNHGVLRPGEAQVMSAGRGILHSEANHSPDRPLRLLQLWIEPRTRGLPPRWEQKAFDPAGRLGRLQPIVVPAVVPVGSGGGNGGGAGANDAPLAIDQDATIYVARLGAGQRVAHAAAPGRRAYVFVISGAAALNGTPLSAGDQARVRDETQLTLGAEGPAELMLIDLP